MSTAFFDIDYFGLQNFDSDYFSPTTVITITQISSGSFIIDIEGDMETESYLVVTPNSYIYFILRVNNPMLINLRTGV